jgi:hypothetical protein
MACLSSSCGHGMRMAVEFFMEIASTQRIANASHVLLLRYLDVIRVPAENLELKSSARRHGKLP